MQSICREINRTFHACLTDSEPNPPHIKAISTTELTNIHKNKNTIITLSIKNGFHVELAISIY